MEMDRALSDAAYDGNVEFLKKAVAAQPPDYFLSTVKYRGNIFQLAAGARRVEFLREAINILPTDIVKQLLSQSNSKENLLCIAALEKCYDLAKVIREMYESVSWSPQDEKPWLAVNSKNMTALHTVLGEVDEENSEEQEKCALEILLTDPEYESSIIVDDDGNTPLYYALRNGFNLVAEKILISPLPATSIYSDSFEDGTTPFSFATNCSENVVRLLFKKLGNWLDITDDTGFTILHQWAVDGEAEPCKILLEGHDVGDAATKVFKEIIFMKENKASDTPLHIAARKKESELGQILIRGYLQKMSLGKEISQELEAAECPPWKITNNDGDTPLHSALFSKHEELALEILTINPTLCRIFNNRGESPFYLAVKFGCARVVDLIMRIDEPRFNMLRCNDGTTMLHHLSALPEETCQMLLNKYWWIIQLRNDQGMTALDYAKRAKAIWLVNLLIDPFLIQKEEFDWIEACKREENEAVLAFVDHCPDLLELCRKANDTPLHYIKLPTFKDYLSFIKHPLIRPLTNSIDHDHATPLHRALQRKDILFAKVLLLDDGVERTIKDNNGITAMNLLAKLCDENEEWDRMCKMIKVDPFVKISVMDMKFIQKGTNLDQMRNTLSVVAALLATITFAAGFTLPGGINSNTGEALLAKKVSFLIFLLADAYAMCTSILVLFCLIWSMVMDSEPDMARLFVDRSMFILMQSLYATLLTFMTGIYTVIENGSLWAAMVIFVMCSVIGISVNKSILRIVLSKLIPIAYREERDRTPAHKEEMEIIIAKDKEKTIE